MVSRAMRRFGRPIAHWGVRIVGLGPFFLLSVALTPVHAAQLTLTWTDASTNEDGFTLERKAGSTGAYGLLTSLPAETTGYVDTTVTAGTTYCYRLRAYNSAGDSAYSNEACAAPAGPTLYTVSVTRSGAGSGTVTSVPGAIHCGGVCSGTVASGTSLALTATPSAGSIFSGWSGVCSGAGTCTLVVENNANLTATFALVPPTTYTLTVTKAGSGTVTAIGIACGSDCTESYTAGTSVTLTATPSAGSTFSGWSGVCAGTGTTCTVSMTTARSVTATFTGQTYALTVAKSGTGSGIVTSLNVSGLDCGTDCTETYAYNTSVTLTATATTDSTFSGWSGACAGTGTTCTVSMTTARSVTASFALQAYTLATGTAGTGSGTITSSPAGISCGTDCTESYPSGTNVTLSTTPATGSTFTGWSGACTGTGPCVVIVNAAKNVIANFALGIYTLTVGKAGTGSGTVTSSPAGIHCGSDCSATFNAGASVTLTAVPTTGYTFTGWSGACTGTGSCTVSMGAAQSVTATFVAQNYPLTVSTGSTGSGTVTSSPAGIVCGATCAATYPYNTTVTLTAAPTTGYTFTGWSGACTGTGATCVLTMTVGRSVTATFAAQTYPLTVSRGGTGAGLVASVPAGINCGPTCSVSFSSGTGVTLQAMPEAGSTFTGWGGACIGTETCTVAMNQAQSVTATFALQRFSLNLSTSGTGRVTSSPAGIDCGGDCAETYSYNTPVTLTATPDPGATFTSWSGACTGSSATCTVTLDRAKSALAAFDLTGSTSSTAGTYTLTVRREGNSKGTVTSSLGGIECGRDCKESYPAGTTVTLSAMPAPGATFVGWGGACGGTGACEVKLNQSTTVTASFMKPRR